MRITFIERPNDSPRADLFKCTLHWQDDTTLLIGWADYIKIARIRERPSTATASGSSNQPPFIVEITAAFQLDCMISGILSNSLSMPKSQDESSVQDTTPSSFLILAYQAPDTYGDEMTEDRARQARKTAERPELRIISHTGEELSADALGVTNYQAWSCNDYVMAEVDGPNSSGRCHVVISPKDIVIVRPRDRKDHILWLVDHQRYDEALEEAEKLDEDERSADGDQSEISPVAIGERYIRHLVAEGNTTFDTVSADISLKCCQATLLRLQAYARLSVTQTSNAGKIGFSFLLKASNCRWVDSHAICMQLSCCFFAGNHSPCPYRGAPTWPPGL